MTDLGAQLRKDGQTTAFRLWAPRALRVQLELGNGVRSLDMRRGERGMFELEVAHAPAGTEYAYRLDGGPPRPDPRSRAQPHGPDRRYCR